MIYFLILAKFTLAQNTTAKVCAKFNDEKVISFPANYAYNSATVLNFSNLHIFFIYSQNSN